MSGLFPDDRSGIAVILGGLILVVLLGAGLSLVSDPTVEEQKEEVSEATGKVADLKAELVDLEEEKRKNKERIARQSEFELLERKWKDAEKSLVDLRARKREEEAAIVQLEKDFSEYRESYRNMVWRKAVGRTYSEFVTGAGKTYREVTIKAVTAREIKLAHVAGTASVPVADLPPALREELQLNILEAAGILEEEQRKEEDLIENRRLEAARKKAEEEERRRKARRGGKDPEAAQELTELEAEYSTVRTKLQGVRRDFLEARRKSGGRQKSPPGSLETWAQRAARLSGVQQKGIIKLRELRVRIRAIDPRWKDPGGENDPFK